MDLRGSPESSIEGLESYYKGPYTYLGAAGCTIRGNPSAGRTRQVWGPQPAMHMAPNVGELPSRT